MDRSKKIFVAGGTGMVGSAVIRALSDRGFKDVIAPDSSELDLTRQEPVEEFFRRTRPDIVIVAAAKVGGIFANNKYRADFIYKNLMITSNVVNSSFENGTNKLLLLGSSCIYPRDCPQPIKEEYLLTGPLESTNEPYAIAKIAGIKLCESYFRQHKSNFFSLMPTNLYGPNDNFDLETSHVIPALIRKFHEGKISGSSEVVIWGSGKPFREFMFVDDLAEAIVFAVENLNADDIYGRGISHLNVGTGEDITIYELATIIGEVIGYEGKIVLDPTKPDGTPRKLMDVGRIRDLGWKHKTDLRTGLRSAYDWFLSNVPDEDLSSPDHSG